LIIEPASGVIAARAFSIERKIHRTANGSAPAPAPYFAPIADGKKYNSTYFDQGCGAFSRRIDTSSLCRD
jgi:hypothetical protein